MDHNPLEELYEQKIRPVESIPLGEFVAEGFTLLDAITARLALLDQTAACRIHAHAIGPSIADLPIHWSIGIEGELTVITPQEWTRRYHAARRKQPTRWYEVEFVVFAPDGQWREEEYGIVREDEDVELLARALSQLHGEEWRIAWDMRGNPDYETDEAGTFLNQATGKTRTNSLQLYRNDANWRAALPALPL